MRFTARAAADLRRAISEAGGVEVFAIGDVEGKRVVDLTITCRGQIDRVTALIDRPRAGQVVIHNHPSGNLTASDADLHLASLYGEDGVGVVIVDNLVARDNWVVEPHVSVVRPVDRALLEAFFTSGLTKAMPDYEPRIEQLQMAHRVADALDADRPLACEAGTGTGKSLAYLAPAALWALANDGKVVVSTFTRALQAQLWQSDLPLLRKGGIEADAAVLQGRANYVCKRRLAVADEEDRHEPERTELDALLDWERVSQDGSRVDLPFAIDPALWERIESDSDLTLQVRCPHYAECRYYSARRKAAAAHVVVVNHALLLADLSLREKTDRGVLPKYARLVVDEGHHLEAAATGAATDQLTARAVSRAIAPLLATKRRRGALDRLEKAFPHLSQLPLRADDARIALSDARTEVAANLEVLSHVLVDPPTRRLTEQWRQSAEYREDVEPIVARTSVLVEQAGESLDAVLGVLEDEKIPDDKMAPVLDVRRARKRLAGHADIARRWLEVGTQSELDWCRWLQRARGRTPSAAIAAAPVEVAPVLKRLLWDPFPGTTATSATLTVNKRFGWWRSRVGFPAEEVVEVVFDSPFDHAEQALLGLPRDLPPPDRPGFWEGTTDAVIDAVTASNGGAFVLCTSYAAVNRYSRALQARTPLPILVQGKAGRAALLQRFKDNHRAVLVGTDSFWEGVSVKGWGLRLVIIPRLPFRVPTEPLRVAQHEKVASRGVDPFRACSLPETVIKLRQGYGRLIRHRDDRGAVVLLDRRVHERSYGRILLSSLPPARRIVGPWRRVRQVLADFYSFEGQRT